MNFPNLPSHLEFKKIVIAIDPAVTHHDESCETGMIVAGSAHPDPHDANEPLHAYIIADLSQKASPRDWALRAAKAYDFYHADRIVAEVNQGGDLVAEVLRSVGSNLPIKLVRASRGKYLRAEPIAALYEQGRVHHCGVFSTLEDQLCRFNPDQNNVPNDRVDALVWALTDLMLNSPVWQNRKLGGL